MLKLRIYPSYREPRAVSVLPVSQQSTCRRLGTALRSNTVTPERIEAFRSGLDQVPAAAVPQGERDIRALATLEGDSGFAPRSKRHVLDFAATKPSSAERLLKEYPDLGWVLIYHADGYAREAGLKALQGPPRNPFEFCTIVYRLNDWVRNVRHAALKYCERYLDETPPEVVALSVFFVTHVAQSLGRWDQAGKNILEKAAARSDVVLHMKAVLLGADQGPMINTFRYMMASAVMDDHLVELAQKAAIPPVRAVAYDSLFYQRAKWFVGYKHMWQDRSRGKSRRIAHYQERPIHLNVDQDHLLEQATRDRSAKVRRIAADVIILRRKENSTWLDDLAQSLAADKSASVRSRIEFYQRKQSEEIG